jgi:NADH-quinone oxidoreductase subunit C
MSENLPHRAAAATPMQAVAWTGDLPERIQAAFYGTVLLCHAYLGQHFVEAPVSVVVPLIEFLRDQEQYDMLTDLTAVDHPRATRRFEIVYFLYSFSTNARVRVKTCVPEDQDVPSIVSVFAGANWLEREIYDMFGVRFAGHPGLKRILLPDEWQGFPLRKDKSIIAMDQDWVRDHLHIESGQ